VVALRDFDQGVVETMGGVVYGNTATGWVEEAKLTDDVNELNYFVVVSGIDPPPGQPGVPITFSNPEDVYEKFKIPVVLVRRDDITPAMQRWHPGQGQYRAPASEALPVMVTRRDGTVLRGYDRYEELPQAVPFDLMYTLEISARNRGSLGIRNQANAIFKHVLKIYPPYCRVLVKDSVDDVRSYEAFMEGTSVLDELMDITARKIGFGLTLRVEAELDLADPEVRRAVTQDPTIRTRIF